MVYTTVWIQCVVCGYCYCVATDVPTLMNSFRFASSCWFCLVWSWLFSSRSRPWRRTCRAWRRRTSRSRRRTRPCTWSCRAWARCWSEASPTSACPAWWVHRTNVKQWHLKRKALGTRVGTRDRQQITFFNLCVLIDPLHALCVHCSIKTMGSFFFLVSRYNNEKSSIRESVFNMQFSGLPAGAAVRAELWQLHGHADAHVYEQGLLPEPREPSTAGVHQPGSEGYRSLTAKRKKVWNAKSKMLS